MKRISALFFTISLFGCTKENIEKEYIYHKEVITKTTNVIDSTSNGYYFEVPILFHYVHSSSSLPTKKEVEEILISLNNNFNGLPLKKNQIVSEFQDKIGNPLIKFVLAKEQTTNGFLVETNADPSIYFKRTNQDIIRIVDSIKQQHGNTSGKKFLNVFIVDFKDNTDGLVLTDQRYKDGNGVVQLPPYPNLELEGQQFDNDDMINGILIDQSSFNPEEKSIEVITHEIGHWLGLKHTFGMGMPFETAYKDELQPYFETHFKEGSYNYAIFNDNIDDTPWTPFQTDDIHFVFQGKKINTQNFMNYTEHTERLMFTQDQVKVMQSTLIQRLFSFE